MFNEHEDLAPEQCPDCGGNHTRTDWIFNFHKCEDCSALWAFDKNDPDYDDEIVLNEEAYRELTENLEESHLPENF